MFPPGFLDSFSEELVKLAGRTVTIPGSGKVDADKLQPGDIISVSLGKRVAKSAPTKLVEEAFRMGTSSTQGAYTHSAIYVGDGQVVESRVGAGVTKRSLQKALGGMSFAVHRPKVRKRDREEAARFAKTQVGKGYDNVALMVTGAGIILPEKVTQLIEKKVISSPRGAKKYTCSNLVVASYHKAQLTNVGKLSAPADFATSKRLKLVTRVKKKGFKETGPSLGRIRRRWRKRGRDAVQ